MKKILLLSMIAVGGLFISSANAQVRISAQININSQPDWGPAGYNYAQYYYLPDANVYYDITDKQYVYQERGRWVSVRMLPPSLRNINLYNSYKVVINERTPWLKNNQYKKMYSNNRNRPQQINWRDSRNKGRNEVARNDRRDSPYGYSNGNNRNNGNDRNDRNEPSWNNSHRH